MARIFVTIGSISGFISVALGAFAAHGLRDQLSEGAIEVFRTGVQYQFLHALALLVVGALAPPLSSSAATWAGWCFVGGTLVFSGSLYALALTGTGAFGAITPVGGLLFLAGWAILAASGMRRTPTSD